ncbi:hypothetical protein PC129_g3561 [Phytophthora cactorum]|uniref:Uncharacterized protein n=1 Tax=Phytophthora cactorum TaxID=29920 RepID=A0A329SUE3_9STRA|nr:hypothetical protein Pcac1_g8495 [Phytophthora cactorum]KAG2849281.1 hypothetical protein PC111_g105 [Phytophthora cactorum]KAG2849484.1 hypothetical protein PC112_g354 [Phytophthora cactorum]KAG2869467.1 hypothetical protein PC113_g148 [Phytophthora cactorum]KAG2936756.1 hypothetical protein PC114_g112 [Phytophthora cactorum]
MDSGGNGSLVGDVHSSGGDIDSLLSNDADVGKQTVRRLHEPYERHRAHDLRAECYRRGIRPIKKGPNANDNKGGYIDLLRRNDGTITSVQGPPSNNSGHQMSKRGDEETEDESVSNGGDNSEAQIISNMTNKRKLPTMTMQTQTDTSSAGELQGFYEGGQPSLVSVLPMQYPASNLGKPTTSTANNPTTDLEILSGIANSYTQNVAADGQLCGNCRTVVTDQLMESIRLGKTKMKLQEWQKMAEQRDRDTHHLKEVLDILQDLRKSYREAQMHRMNHEILVELQDDIAFFRSLKEQAKERMRQAMQDARERSNNSNVTA